MSKKILILGSAGLLGSSLINFFVKNNINVFCHTRNATSEYSADLTDEIQILKVLRSLNPDVVINLAGLTNVDECQKNHHEAYLCNVKILENMKKYFSVDNPSCHLIHISTDHLYDSPKPNKINEINLKNTYAFSKYAGEIVASSFGMNVSILRTNFFGRSLSKNRSSFTDWLYESITNKNRIQVFDDVKFSPLSMHTLVNCINLVIEKGPIGIVNIGSRQGLSKASFAFNFIDGLNLDCSYMTKIDMSDAKFLNTPRPFDMRMDSSNFENIFKIKLPNLIDEIKLTTEDYYEKF